jgi:hypothetical protein
VLLAASQWLTQWQPGSHTFWQRGAPETWKARMLKWLIQHAPVETSPALPYSKLIWYWILYELKYSVYYTNKVHIISYARVLNT